MDYGVDVSMWNAISDADSVRDNGITFAWCKATEGTGYVDPTFFNKVRQLRSAGIVVGAYHFARAGSAVEQARHFRQVAGDAGCLDTGALLPMNDMEAADVRPDANGYVDAFYDAVGIEPMSVYGNLDWWRNALNYNAWGRRDLLGHIAHYNGDPGAPGWTYPRAAVHQHTQEGTVPGIAGNVDRNATLGTYDLRSITIGNAAPSLVPPGEGGTTAPDDGDVWRVDPGDTLSRIASAWGLTVSAVATANSIPDPNTIYVGQVIHRPGTQDAAPGPVASGGTYTVHSGDTLSGIASAQGTSSAVLVALNHLANPDRIYPGDVLVLPGGAMPADRFHVVQDGEYLGAIAELLGYPGGYPALAARNGITDPGLIFPGQRIYY